MKNFLFNSVKSIFVWAFFNWVFFALDSALSSSWFFIFSFKENVANYVFLFLIVLLLVAALIGMYFWGKAFLKTTGNVFLDFLSMFPVHILILYMLYLATKSEHTMILMITWPLYILQKICGERFELLSNDLNYSFTFGVILSCIPYLIMYIGLLVKTLKKHDEKSQ